MEIRPKVVITKIGLDGHDRGSRIVAAYLRDAGMEVIYTPPWQQIQALVKLALEEDVDVIGVSSLATDHLIVPALVTALRDAGLDDVAVIVGGIVPDADEDMLLAAGVARVFHPGTPLAEIAAYIAEITRGIRRARNAIAQEHAWAPPGRPKVRIPPPSVRRLRPTSAGGANIRPGSAPTAKFATAPASRSSRSTRRKTGAASATPPTSVIRASRRTRAASTRRCIAGARGRSGS